MTFSSIVVYLVSGDHLIATLPIFVFVAFLSAYLAPHGRIRYVSAIPLFLIFLVIPLTGISFLMVTPAIVYMIWTFPKPSEDVKRFHYQGVFEIFLVIFIVVLIALFFIVAFDVANYNEFPNDSFLFATSFLLNSIIFMRLVRHDKAIFTQPRFKVMNVAVVAGVMIGAVLFSTDASFGFVNLVWSLLLAPIFGLIFRGIAAFFRMLGFNADGLEEVFDTEDAPSFEVDRLDSSVSLRDVDQDMDGILLLDLGELSLQDLSDLSLLDLENVSLQDLEALPLLEIGGLSIQDLNNSSSGQGCLSRQDLNESPLGQRCPSLQDLSDSSVLDLGDLSLQDLNDSSALKLDDLSLQELDDLSLEELDNLSLQDLGDLSIVDLDDLSLQDLNNSPSLELDDLSLHDLNDLSLLDLDDSSLQDFGDMSVQELRDLPLQELGDLSVLDLDDLSLQDLEDSSLLDFGDLPLLDFDELPFLEPEDLLLDLDDLSSLDLEDLSLLDLDEISLEDLDNLSLINPENVTYLEISEDRETNFVPLIVAFTIVALIVLLLLSFKRFSSKVGSTALKEEGLEEERVLLDEKEKRGFFKRQAENEIRAVYQRFLAAVKKKGLSVPPHLTSYDVETLVAAQFESEKSGELRDEYIRVRYGEANYTAADVERIKALYKEVKAEIEIFEYYD